MNNVDKSGCEPVNICRETPSGCIGVYELVKAAFATSTNEGEWEYLNEF